MINGNGILSKNIQINIRYEQRENINLYHIFLNTWSQNVFSLGSEVYIEMW